MDLNEGLPLVLQLAWDPDRRVRDAVMLNLDSVQPNLAVSYDRTTAVTSLPSLLYRYSRFEVGLGEPLAGGRSSKPAANEHPPGEQPPGGPAAGEEVIRRYTYCDFTADAEDFSSGRVLFALRIEAIGSDSRPIDLRVPPGRESVPILVHAFSDQFELKPPETKL